MKVYVTYQVRPSEYLRLVLGHETKKYAIECESESQAIEVASDVNSLDGVSYIYINRCGKLPKGCKILKVKNGEYF